MKNKFGLATVLVMIFASFHSNAQTPAIDPTDAQAAKELREKYTDLMYQVREAGAIGMTMKKPFAIISNSV